MKQKRSAKDIAFEKERMEFRSEIKHLKKSLNEQQMCGLSGSDIF